MGPTAAAIIIFTSKAMAAPALSGPICEIEGVVTKIAERTHKYDESLREAWKLPESTSYIDVTIDVRTARLNAVGKAQNCDVGVLKKRPFQLKDPADQSKLKTGACLKALTQFSGDEFRLGQWLWRIESCATDKP